MKECSAKTIIIGIRLRESEKKDDTEKHGLIVKVDNRGNKFRTTVEPNLNSYFSEIINFSKTLETIIVRDKTLFSLQYH